MEATYKTLTLKCAGFEGITIKVKKTGFMGIKKPFISHNISTLFPTLVPIESCKKGDYFMLKPTNKLKQGNVYCFDGYCNMAKKYTSHKFCVKPYTHRAMKKGTMVYVGFDY